MSTYLSESDADKTKREQAAAARRHARAKRFRAAGWTTASLASVAVGIGYVVWSMMIK